MEFLLKLVTSSSYCLHLFATLMEVRDSRKTTFEILPEVYLNLGGITADDYKNFSFVRILRDAQSMMDAIPVAIDDIKYEIDEARNEV